MESVSGAADNMLGSKGKNERETLNQGGVLTPETTPALEDGRVEADKERRAREAAEKLAKQQQNPPQDSDDEGDETKKTQPTEEQDQAVQRVLKCKKKDYRRILGVQDKYGTPEVEQEAILTAFRKLGTLIHADYIEGDDTKKAYDRVLTAARKLGVEQDDINEVKTWDGEEDLTSRIEVDKDEIPWPTNFIAGIYQEATQHLGRLCEDPNDSAAISSLDALNRRIREQNEKDGNKPDQWTIDYKMYLEQFRVYKPHVDSLWKTPEGQPMDPEAISKINSLNDQLKKINVKYHFPETWVMHFPTAEQLAERHAKNRTAKEAKEKEEREKLEREKEAKEKEEREKLEREKLEREKEAKEKEEREKLEREKEAKEKEEKEKLEREKLEREKEEREKLEREKLEREKLQEKTKFGNITFPWATYPLLTGERIITGRKSGVGGPICCVEIPGTDPNNPDFQFRKDIDPLEMEKYFATPGIKTMGETDEEGRPVKVWQNKEKDGFVRFIACVVGERKISSSSKPPAAECLCFWEMKDGIKLGTRSGLKRLLGAPADGYIGRYCKEKKITAPWDVKPKQAIIPYEQKEMMDKLQSNMMTNLAAGSPGGTGVNLPSGNSTAGNSAFKGLEDKLAALERRIENLQAPQVGGRSLESILSRLEERLGSMETKVAKVDDLAAKLEKTATILEKLAVKVGL